MSILHNRSSGHGEVTPSSEGESGSKTKHQMKYVFERPASVCLLLFVYYFLQSLPYLSKQAGSGGKHSSFFFFSFLARFIGLKNSRLICIFRPLFSLCFFFCTWSNYLCICWGLITKPVIKSYFCCVYLGWRLLQFYIYCMSLDSILWWSEMDRKRKKKYKLWKIVNNLITNLRS